MVRKHNQTPAAGHCTIEGCRECGSMRLRIGAICIGVVLASTPAIDARLLDALIRAAHRRQPPTGRDPLNGKDRR